mmetsp:Transcript_36650/g.91880  ORF Transcript_36650/g.91880 Transcript_36650/m.91880 type:complete len:117 (+) Transcript_36650:105-455(+)
MANLQSLLINSISIFVCASFLPGVHVDSFFTAFIVAIVLALVNAFIAPVVLLLTLPLNIVTLGLFTFIVIGLMVVLSARIVNGFEVDGIFSGLLFAFFVSLVNSLLHGHTESGAEL